MHTIFNRPARRFRRTNGVIFGCFVMRLRTPPHLIPARRLGVFCMYYTAHTLHLQTFCLAMVQSSRNMIDTYWTLRVFAGSRCRIFCVLFLLPYTPRTLNVFVPGLNLKYSVADSELHWLARTGPHTHHIGKINFRVILLYNTVEL